MTTSGTTDYYEALRLGQERADLAEMAVEELEKRIARLTNQLRDARRELEQWRVAVAVAPEPERISEESEPEPEPQPDPEPEPKPKTAIEAPSTKLVKIRPLREQDVIGQYKDLGRFTIGELEEALQTLPGVEPPSRPQVRSWISRHAHRHEPPPPIERLPNGTYVYVEPPPGPTVHPRQPEESIEEPKPKRSPNGRSAVAGTGKVPRGSNHEINQLIKRCRRAGATATKLSGGHYMISHRDKAVTVTIASTGGKGRGLANAAAKLRSDLGLDI